MNKIARMCYPLSIHMSARSKALIDVGVVDFAFLRRVVSPVDKG